MPLAALRSTWVRDAASAVGLFAAGLLVLRVLPDAMIDWFPAPDPDPRVSVAVLGLACSAVVLRRTLPLAGLAVAGTALAAGPAALGTSGIGTVVAFADLLYCAVLYTSRAVSRAVCVVTGVLVAGLTLTALIGQGGRGALLALLNLLLLALPVLWAYEVRRHRELAAVERARADQAAQLAERDRQAAVAAERARMARDLHDVVAGQLSAIALQSEAGLGDPALRERVLQGVRDASVSALAEMRTMIGLLRETPGGADEPRTAPARLDQLDRLLSSARSWGLRVDVVDERSADGDPTAAAVELAAYRIVQEGLTNVAKHAPGAAVSVRLWHDGERLAVRVTNGSGTTTHPAGQRAAGTGLEGLRERAAAVGGTLSAGPDGDGWCLSASLPRCGATAPV